MINFTAVNIYFMLGAAQVYNISDHCTIAILVGFLHNIRNERLLEIFDSVKDVSIQSIHHLLSALVKLK